MTIVPVPSLCSQADSAPTPAHGERAVQVEADGTFRFENLPPAVYRVELCLASARCYEVPPWPLVSYEDMGPIVLRNSAASRARTRPAEQTTTTAYRVSDGGNPPARQPSGPVVRGSVRDAISGAPVGGAFVWTDHAIRCYATTGPDGAFALPAPDAEDRILRAAAPRYLEATVRAVAGRPDTSADLALTPAPAVVQGTVHSWMGGPVPGALIFLPEYDRWARTSEEGAFEITRLPHPAKVRAEITAPGFEDAEVALPTALSSEPQKPAVVTLESAFRAAGEVRDAANRPLEGVAIEVPGKWPQPRFVHTDAAGRFSVPIPRPGYFSLRLLKPGMPPAYTELMVTTETPKVELGVIRLGGALQVWGVVRAADGEPLEGVEVFDTGHGGSVSRDAASRRPQEAPVARTGDGGAFEYRIERGSRQTTHLEFWKEGFVPRQEKVPLHEPELPLLIFLDEAHEIRGKVVDAAGTPIEGAIVQLDGGRPKLYGTSRLLKTGPDGEFTISALASGSFRIGIGREGYAAKVVEVREEPLEEDLELRIVLSPEARVHGRVVDRLGRPVSGVQVQIKRPGEEQGYLIFFGHGNSSGADGSFFLHSLPPGPTRFELWKNAADGRPVRIYEEAVLFPGLQELELVWDPPGGAE